jgi:predicted nicotinamide N-methyase
MASRFDVAVEDVPCAARHFRIAMVHQPEKLLDAITSEKFAEDERLPYWAELWTSALALSDRLLHDPDLQGADLLELGCGLGLAGIAAATAGARVTMTDYDQDALMFARWNALTNLDATAMERVSIAPLDWREPPVRLYDRIIGADIVYERRHFAPLLSFFEAALKPAGSVLLTEPDRSIGDDFFAAAGDRGFRVSIERLPWERRGRTSTVRLVTMQPRRKP